MCVCVCVCVCVSRQYISDNLSYFIVFINAIHYHSPDVIWMLPQTHKTPSHKAARRTSLAFDNIDTRDMAHTLAYLDFKLFRRISVCSVVCFMCACMCLYVCCMYVFVVCTYVYVYACVHTCMHTYIHTYVCVYSIFIATTYV